MKKAILWSKMVKCDTENVIYEFLLPDNVGIDTNIVLLGYLELKLCGKNIISHGGHLEIQNGRLLDAIFHIRNRKHGLRH